MYTPLRHHLITPLALCILAACSSDLPDDDGGRGNGKGVEMSFAVSDAAGTGSRAATTNNLKTQGSTFAVFGDQKKSGYPEVTFNAEKVYYNATDDQWNYAYPRYWSPDHEHSFVAFHPADAAGISDIAYSRNKLSFSFTLPDDFTTTPDLLVAAHRRIHEEPENPIGWTAPPVRLNFSHILSRINFVAESGADDMVKITKIELQGVNKTATLTVTPATLSSGGKQTDDYTAAWTGHSDAGTLTAAINVDVPNDGKEHILLPDNNALFVIPQPGNKEVTAKITYELHAKDPISGELKKYDEKTLTSQPIDHDWEQGKAYLYSLNINLKKQELNIVVSVTEWLTGTSQNVTVPGN